MEINPTQPVHIEPKSTVETWNSSGTRLRNRSVSIPNSFVKNRSLKINDTQNENQTNQRMIFHESKPSIDTWNEVTTENNIQTSNSTLLNRKGLSTNDRGHQAQSSAMHRADRSYTTDQRKKAELIDFDHVKPTINTWNEQVRSKYD